MQNKETLYTKLVRYLIDEGAFDRRSPLLTDKLTLKVRDPVNEGVQAFLEDITEQLLQKMTPSDTLTMAKYLV